MPKSLKKNAKPFWTILVIGRKLGVQSMHAGMELRLLRFPGIKIKNCILWRKYAHQVPQKCLQECCVDKKRWLCSGIGLTKSPWPMWRSRRMWSHVPKADVPWYSLSLNLILIAESICHLSATETNCVRSVWSSVGLWVITTTHDGACTTARDSVWYLYKMPWCTQRPEQRTQSLSIGQAPYARICHPREKILNNTGRLVVPQKRTSHLCLHDKRYFGGTTASTSVWLSAP